MANCLFCGAPANLRGRVRDRESRAFCTAGCQAAYAEIAWAAATSEDSPQDGRYEKLRGLTTDRWGVPHGGPALLQALRAQQPDLAVRAPETPRDVLEQAQQRADKDPADATLHLELGLAYAQMPDMLPQAEDALRRALDYGLDSAKMRGVVHARLAHIYLRRGLAFAEEHVNDMSRAGVLEAWRHVDGAISSVIHPLNLMAPEFKFTAMADLKALACTEQWLERLGGGGSKRFFLLVKGHAEEAQKELGRHLSQRKDDREAMLELGAAYRELGDVSAYQRLADRILRSRALRARAQKAQPQQQPAEKRRPPGRSFTQRCLSVLENEGFEVESKEAPTSGELNIVARLCRPLFFGKYIVHCRDLDRPIGHQDVLELYGTTKAANALKGIMFCRSGYAKEVREWARGRELELLDENALSWLEEAAADNGHMAAKRLDEAQGDGERPAESGSLRLPELGLNAVVHDGANHAHAPWGKC